jgi:hypothetical protein
MKRKMAIIRTSLSDSWVTRNDLANTVALIKNFARVNRVKIKGEQGEDPKTITASQGSTFKMGMMGPLCSDDDLPRNICFQLMSQGSNGTKVDVVLEEIGGHRALVDNLMQNQVRRYHDVFNLFLRSLMTVLPPVTEIAPEAADLFQKTLSKWEHADETKNIEDLKKDIISWLATAIKKANAPFPGAHTQLALFLNDVGDDKNAYIHATIALRHNPNNFRAQLVRVDNFLRGVKIAKPGVPHFLETKAGSLEANIALSVIKTAVTALLAADAALTQSAFRKELLRLVEIFRETCRTNNDVDEFLYMANSLILVGDIIKDMPIGGKPNLFKEVADAPTNLLIMNGKEQVIMETCAKAEGRAIFLKS